MQKAELALLEGLDLDSQSPDYIKLDGKLCSAQDICERVRNDVFYAIQKNGEGIRLYSRKRRGAADFIYGFAFGGLRFITYNA